MFDHTFWKYSVHVVNFYIN